MIYIYLLNQIRLFEDSCLNVRQQIILLIVLVNVPILCVRACVRACVRECVRVCVCEGT